MRSVRFICPSFSSTCTITARSGGGSRACRCQQLLVLDWVSGNAGEPILIGDAPLHRWLSKCVGEIPAKRLSEATLQASHPLGRHVAGLDDGTSRVDRGQQDEAHDEEGDERKDRRSVTAGDLV